MKKTSIENGRVYFRVTGEATPEIVEIMKKRFGNELTILYEAGVSDVPLDEDGEPILKFPDEDDELEDWRLSSGKSIRNYRDNRGWTQAQLGEMLGVKASFVSDLENNRRAVSKKMAKFLANLFNVSVAEFV